MKIDKQKMLTVVLPVILIVLVLIIGAVNIFGGIKAATDTITHEAGQEFVPDAAVLFKIDEKTAAKVTFDTSKVDVNKAGTYELTADYKMHTYRFKVEVEDTTAPSVEFTHRYVFTNDVKNADLESMIDRDSLMRKVSNIKVKRILIDSNLIIDWEMSFCSNDYAYLKYGQVEDVSISRYGDEYITYREMYGLF